MKNNLIAVFFMMAASVGFTSCDSDDQPLDNPPVATFTLSIDGEPFVATQATAVQEDNVITISATRGDNGERIELVVWRTSPGTSVSPLRYFADNDAAAYENYDMLEMDDNGYVTLSSVNENVVSGTFAFKGYLGGSALGIKEFKNGEFTNIPLTVLSGNGLNNTESLFAIVDGAETLFNHINVSYNDGTIAINGLEAGVMRSITISIPENVTVGTHPIGSDISGNYASISGTLVFQSVSGTLTITNNSNGWLTGSFSFTGQDNNSGAHQVTAGHFHVAIN